MYKSSSNKNQISRTNQTGTKEPFYLFLLAFRVDWHVYQLVKKEKYGEATLRAHNQEPKHERTQAVCAQGPSYSLTAGS